MCLFVANSIFATSVVDPRSLGEDILLGFLECLVVERLIYLPAFTQS